MTDQPAERPDYPWMTLSRGVLNLAVHDNMDNAVDLFTVLVERYGLNDLATIILTWIDSLLYVNGVRSLDQLGRYPVKLDFSAVNADGSLTASPTDESPPEAVWAGRLLAARLGDDEATYNALMASIPDGRAGDYALWALDVIATTIRMHQQQGSSALNIVDLPT